METLRDKHRKLVIMTIKALRAKANWQGLAKCLDAQLAPCPPTGGVGGGRLDMSIIGCMRSSLSLLWHYGIGEQNIEVEQ